MSAHPWHDIPLPDDPSAWFSAYIEIPMGSTIKYELDKPSGLLRVDRLLYSAVYYPANYGFIPQTYCPDKDPLDVLVLGREAVTPGCLLRAHAIGVMRMLDNKAEDDKIIAVHLDDPDNKEVRDLADLPPHRLRQLQRFFMDYKALEDKEVKVETPHGRELALQILQEAIDLYARERDHLRQTNK